MKKTISCCVCPGHRTFARSVAQTLTLLFTIIVVAFGVTGCGGLSNSSPPAAKHDILTRTFTQAAHELSWYTFSIPASAKNARVAGTVTLSDENQDILIVIVDEAELTKFKNGMPYRAYFDSGKVNKAFLNFTIPPGTYYVIVSNTHSLLDPKTVNANIYAEY